MVNGKISQFLKEHWRGAVLVVGVAFYCTSLLYCCKNGAELLVKNNKVVITKTTTK